MTKDPWFLTPDPPDAPEVTFVAFPHAGGSGSVYRGWQRWLGPSADLCAVQYPGHTGRFAEPLWYRCEALANAVASRLVARSDRPVVLFGHSMGSLVAFEVAVRLEQRYGISPAHLFVSGSPGPQFPPRTTVCSRFSDEQLTAWLREMGGCEESVIVDQDLLGILLPVLRADLAVGETYRPWRGTGVSCPVTSLTGAGDSSVTPAENRAWRETTSGPFRQRIFPGGHFYLHDEAARDVVRFVRRTIEDLPGVRGPATAGVPGSVVTTPLGHKESTS